MTEEELRENVIECMRRAHFMDYAFIHGEEYVKKHRAWIDWEFERKLKQMTNTDLEKVIKGYVEALKEVEHDRTRRTGEGMAQQELWHRARDTGDTEKTGTHER